MASEPLFMDTGGFFALLSAEDASHRKASAVMEEAGRIRRRAVTTDYVLDETATLLRARGLTKHLKGFLRMTPDRFASARKFMLKHIDQEFSFTDCASFVVMTELRLTDALATDRHFRIAGFNPLLLE
jgi:uncharacterized protein